MQLQVLESMLRSIPGASWLLVDGVGAIGYAAGELDDALQLDDVVHPDDLPSVLRGVSMVLSEPSHTFVDRVRVRSGDAWRASELTAVNRCNDPELGAIVVRVLPAEEQIAPAAPRVALPDDLIGSLAEAVPTPILVADQSGIVVFSNSAARTLLGEQFGQVTEQLAGARSQGTTRLTFELGRRWIHARIAARADGWVAMLDDVTADDDESDVVRQAMTDQLTGLSNRVAFDLKLSQVLAAADGMPVSIVVVHLQGLKGVNERHGPDAGDQVLKVSAARLKRTVRPGDVVARIGGAEFGMICPGLNADNAPLLAERAAETVRERMNVGSARVVIGAEVGTASTPPVRCDAASLLEAIDRAMHHDASVETWTPQIEL